MIRVIERDMETVSLNLALEHSILKNKSDSNSITVRFWRNGPAVILGRTQKFTDEINESYCKKNQIEVSRRISGGGTVYHDSGNLNLSFFIPVSLMKKTKNLSDIHQTSNYMTVLILETLQDCGYKNLEPENGTNILYNNEKISGAAGYYLLKNYLHHCTLLTSTNLKHLNNSLLAREANPADKRKSRYFKTRNIDNFDYTLFKEMLLKKLSNIFNYEIVYDEPKEDEIQLSIELAHDLYDTDNWIINGKRKI